MGNHGFDSRNGDCGYGVRASAEEVQVLEGNGVQAQFDGKTGNVSLYGYREDGTRFQMSRPSQISYPVVEGSVVDDFADFACQVEEDVDGTAGKGGRMTVTYRSKGTGLTRVCELEAVDGVEGLLHVKTSYEAGNEAVEVEKFVDCEFSLFAPKETVWSYNGGGEGTQSWYDTLQKIVLNDNDTFYRANKQDETSAGIPVADIYSADGGITVGDASATRRSLQTPVAEKDGTVYAAIQRPSRTVGAREKLAAGEGFVEVHGGDYYVGLRGYSEGMRRIGFQTLDREEIPESSYDLRWESWGWEFDWTLELILDKLDELEALGIKQVTLDDGWYINAGEWNLTPEKLPNGDADMKRLTDAIHAKGMTALLWWRPCDGGREESALYKEHPEYFVQNEDGSVGKLAGPGGFNSFNGTTGYALCPSSEGAVKSQVDFVKKALNDWGFDGLKSDYVWSIPKCYNPAHHHERPEESTEQQAVFYREAYETMRECNPDAFHLLCNCGAPQDYYSFPYVTQIPTADPTTVDQTRRRVKAYKALAGDYFPVTTDHNELWYPSAVGTGAVLIEKRNMTGALQADYEKWLKIAQRVELQKGEFIGDLYSYGFDPYETYVVNKDGVMYYAFYRDGTKYSPQGNPKVELKGLDPCKMYRIVDYVNDRVIATNVRGSQAVFDCSFAEYLLVRAEELSAPDADIVVKEISAEETELQFDGTWTAEQNNMFSGGGSKYTQESGTSVSFTFQGSGIAWYGQKDSNFGTAKIYIDNALQEEVSCTGAAAAGVKLYEKTGLSDGSHTIRIECVTPVIDIDRFVYTQKEAGNAESSGTVSDFASSFKPEGFMNGKGWEAFEAAKSRWENLRQEESADPSAVAEAEEAFFNAMFELRKEVKKESIGTPVLYPAEVDTEEQDFSMLYRAIAYAEKLDMQNVIPAVREQYEKALAQARQVFQDTDADQNAINRAWAELLDKIQYAGFTAGDKTGLNQAVADCQKVTLSSYENTAAFEAALNEAKKTLADENALDDEVKRVMDKLKREHGNLTPKTVKPPTGGSTQKVPGQAGNVKAVPQANSLKVTWKKQADAASYTVFIFKDGKWQAAGTTAGDSFNITNLKPAKKYQVKVTACNAAGAGKESAVVYAATKPAKPKVKSVKNYKTTGIKITCKKNGESGFEVWVKNGKKAYKKAAKGSKTVILKKGIRASGKVSVKIRGYVKYKGTTSYGAFAKVKL